MPNFGRLSVFDEIYKEGFWGNGSGGGSSLGASKPYVQFLEKFLKSYQIKRVVDVGCGDWQFMRYVDLTGIDYTGIDAAQSVIAANERAFGTENIRFVHFDGDYGVVPKADLLLCKDVLQHLDTESVRSLIKSLIPRFRYSLITNDVPKRSLLGRLIDRLKRKNLLDAYGLNKDIDTGDYRLLDLRMPPFLLKGNVALEWEANPYSFAQRIKKPKNTLLGETCEWRKRTLLFEGAL